MTEEDRAELYLLRRHCGVSAHEARNVLPAWEVELLLDGIRTELSAAQAGAEPDLTTGA